VRKFKAFWNKYRATSGIEFSGKFLCFLVTTWNFPHGCCLEDSSTVISYNVKRSQLHKVNFLIKANELNQSECGCFLRVFEKLKEPQGTWDELENLSIHFGKSFSLSLPSPSHLEGDWELMRYFSTVYSQCINDDSVGKGIEKSFLSHAGKVKIYLYAVAALWWLVNYVVVCVVTSLQYHSLQSSRWIFNGMY